MNRSLIKWFLIVQLVVLFIIGFTFIGLYQSDSISNVERFIHDNIGKTRKIEAKMNDLKMPSHNVDVVSNNSSTKTHVTVHIPETKKKEADNNEPVKAVHVPDQVHPKNQKDLWIQISLSYVVRRIGYLDMRNEKDVRIHLISLLDKKRPIPKLFIKIYYNNNSGKTLCLRTKLELGSLDGHDHFVLYLVHSPRLAIDERGSISHITIATNSDCRNESSPIAINAVDAKEYKYNFSICLHKSVRPNLDPKVVLDWVKLNLALGTEFMTVYIQTGAEKIYDILLPYINKGLVEVLDWKMEPPLIAERSYHDGQTGVIAECVWRNMNRVKYLGMNDADEFFIPQQHSSLLEMMKALDTPMPKRYGSFLFTNTLMKDNGRLLPIVERALKSNKCPGLDAGSLPVYFKRTQSCKTWAEKIVVIPDAVFTAWPHHLISYRSDKYTKQYSVPNNVGLSQHYRPRWNDYFGCPGSSRTETTIAVGKFFTNVTHCVV